MPLKSDSYDANWWPKGAGDFMDSDPEPPGVGQGTSSSRMQLNEPTSSGPSYQLAREEAIRALCASPLDFDERSTSATNGGGVSLLFQQASDASGNNNEFQDNCSNQGASNRKLIEDQMSAMNQYTNSEQRAKSDAQGGVSQSRPAAAAASSDSFASSSHALIWSLKTASLKTSQSWEDAYTELDGREATAEGCQRKSNLSQSTRSLPSTAPASGLSPRATWHEDQAIISQRFGQEVENSNGSSQSDWKHVASPYSHPQAQFSPNTSTDVYQGHSTYFQSVPLERQASFAMATRVEMKHNEQWPVVPAQKKPRSQMLTSLQAVEIYRLRPSQMPIGTMLVAHAQEVRLQYAHARPHTHAHMRARRHTHTHTCWWHMRKRCVRLRYARAHTHTDMHAAST
jgi:hypothetical protein